jgi:arabinofuranan 3-O-arabinosyltransferase
VTLSGGPEALAGSVAVDPGEPLVAVADQRVAAGDLDTDRWLVTDTLRRRALNFGAAAGQAYGPTLPASADPRLGRPAADVLPYDGVSHETTSQLVGAVAVTASSSAADPFAVGYRGPAYGAVAAFDGDPASQTGARG